MSEPRRRRAPMTRRDRFLIWMASVAFIIALFLLIVVGVLGLVRPFLVPTGSMTPAISPGDHVAMEGVTFLFRNPRRSDIVIFKTDGIPSMPAATIYEKRVVAEPGEQFHISDGKLFINGQRVAISNAAGEIIYQPPPGMESFSTTNDIVIPPGCYFVIGDNSTNSLDSRMYGAIPRSNIMGRVWFCYWPSGRIGRVK